MACHGVMKWRRKQCFIVRLFYEARLRRMKRHVVPWSAPAVHEAKPDGFIFFALESRQKNGRPFLLKLENSLKLKRLRIYIKWSSLRYLAKTSLFSAFWKQRKFFCSPERTFSPKQTQNPLKKDSNLRLFKKDAKVGGCHSITSRIFIKYFHEDFYMYNILLKIITYHQKKQIPESWWLVR